jgi:hypothetical protein
MTTSVEGYIHVDDETFTKEELLALAYDSEADAQVLEWISTCKFDDVALAVIANWNTEVETVVALANQIQHIADDGDAIEGYDYDEVAAYAKDAIIIRYRSEAETNSLGETYTADELRADAICEIDDEALAFLSTTSLHQIAYLVIENKNTSFVTLATLYIKDQHDSSNYAHYDYEGVSEAAKAAITERYPDFDFDNSDVSEWLDR